MNPEKLIKLQENVRIGGKGTMRRKKKSVHRSTRNNDKKLPDALKKLSVKTIPGIEEVNIFQNNGLVIQIKNPEVQASLPSNMYAISGSAEIGTEDMLRNMLRNKMALQKLRGKVVKDWKYVDLSKFDVVCLYKPNTAWYESRRGFTGELEKFYQKVGDEKFEIVSTFVFDRDAYMPIGFEVKVRKKLPWAELNIGEEQTYEEIIDMFMAGVKFDESGLTLIILDGQTGKMLNLNGVEAVERKIIAGDYSASKDTWN